MELIVKGSCGDVRWPNRVLANSIARHKAERRPGLAKNGVPRPKHEQAKVGSMLINQAKGPSMCSPQELWLRLQGL